tara:strand:+ start:105 stop:1289 length:1185 start_codon:yes stop_codon:yes gene_type:complete
MNNSKYAKQQKPSSYTSLAAYRYGGKKKGVKKYPAGGMYADNTVSAGGQGSGSTTNIVFKETNPEILAAKKAAMEQEKLRLQQEANLTQQEVLELNEASKIAQAEAAANVGETGKTVIGAAKTGLDLYKKATTLKKTPTTEVLTTTGTDTGGPTAAQITPTGGTAGSMSNIPVGIAAPPPPTYGSGLIGPPQAPPTAPPPSAPTPLITTAGSAGTAAPTGLMSTTGVGASGIGTGLTKFATSGAGIGTIASIVGEGVKYASDDKDPTTVNFGEGAGAALSGAGMGIGAATLTGMAMGSAVPVAGNIIGAVVGAAYGLGSALVARKKARKAKAKYEADIQAKKDKHNKEVTKSFGDQMAMVRAGELEQKTYSGYDLGRNVGYRTGGRLQPLMKYA